MSQMLMLRKGSGRFPWTFFLAYYGIEFRISHENEWYFFFFHFMLMVQLIFIVFDTELVGMSDVGFGF